MLRLCLLILFAISLCGTAYSQTKNAESDFSGLWVDSNSAEFKNCFLIISQTANKVKIIHYLEFNGTPMVEEGKGKISGSNVSYKVTVTKAIPGWATKGEHVLELSNDKKTLRGYYKDSKGNTGPIVFKRKT